MSDLFSNCRPEIEEIYPDMFLLANFVDQQSQYTSRQFIELADDIATTNPFRQMMTPNGHQTSIAMTNCGDYGWVSDKKGYRYSPVDPLTLKPWPAIPTAFLALANNAAIQCGYLDFNPDSCLINQYSIGAKLGAHQDKDEKNFDWPIVSLSLGLAAEFQIFGDQRSGRLQKTIILLDGDLLLWGGASRLVYHGIKTIKREQQNPSLKRRINLTLRKAI